MLCQVLEAELQAHESLYQGVLARGQDLLSKQSPVSQRAIQNWIKTLKRQWSHMTEEATGRRDKLQAAAAIKQVEPGNRKQEGKTGTKQTRRKKEVLLLLMFLGRRI